MSDNVLAKMRVELTAQNAQFNRAFKQSQNQMTGFAAGFRSLAGTIASVIGTAQMVRWGRENITILADFEKHMSEVRAITGAVGKEFQSLEQDAKRLGSSTKYTASQVAQLQVAYGRLGFTTKEILAATEATLNLAAATGEDLAKSADVAGSTVRGFELDAKETNRVVDVMTSSFNKSALGLDNFTESMKYVAPVANAAGATVEEATAMLAALADAGIRGSMAGTSLRRIFTDMTKDGRPLQDRLDELGRRGLTLSDAFDEVGRTAQTSLLILTKNTDKIKSLANEFNNASGEAEKMARIMQDNLHGDVVKLTSAWEGLILTIGDTRPWRNFVKDITGIINGISGTKDLERLLELSAQFAEQGLFDIEGSGKGIIEELKEIRREMGKPLDARGITESMSERFNLSSEAANRFYQVLLDVNKAQSFQEKSISQFNEFAERNGYSDLSKAADDYKNKLYSLILQQQISNAESERLMRGSGADVAKLLQPSIDAGKEQIAQYRRVIQIIEEYRKSVIESGKDTKEALEVPLAIIPKLKKQIEDYKAAQNASFDTNQIQWYSYQIELLEAKLKSLTKVRIDITPNIDDSGFDGLFKNIEARQKKVFQSIDKRYAVLMERFQTNYQEQLEARTRAIQESMLRTAEIAQMTGIAIGDAFGEALAGQKSYVVSLARITGQIVELYLQQSIAAIIKAAINDPTNPLPWTKIAAAGVAIGLVRVLFSKVGSTRGGGGGAGSSGYFHNLPQAGSGNSGLRVEISGRISGYDMDLMESKNGYKRSRVG